MSNSLGERVRQKRLSLNLTVQELAQKADVSASYIYAIESGQLGSRIEKLSKIAKALETSLPDIWPYDA